MVADGSGQAGGKKFGFRRGVDNYREVDPEQRPFILRIPQDYAALGKKDRRSLLRLEEHMATMNCPISRENLGTILRDPIYVTGEWGSTALGEFYPGKKVDIDGPISADL